MKKILIAAIMIGLFSCKKDRTCVCDNVNGNGTQSVTINTSKRKANSTCESYIIKDVNGNRASGKCYLKD